ncbi:MAG: DUF4242 domain-containing protein [Rhizobiaceae bacterium]
MKRFIIQRDLPDVGKATVSDLRPTIKASNDALRQLAPDVQWIESYLTEDQSFCVYLAESEDAIREHGKISGIPVGEITEVKRIISPVTN